VQERVAGVDLDQVVHDHQLEHVPDVDLLVRVLGQDQRHQRQMPGVLGVVLPPVGGGQRRAPQHGLEPVGLDQEAQLLPEPVPDAVGKRIALHQRRVFPRTVASPAISSHASSLSARRAVVNAGG
jgi:hypothetical protein